MQKRIDFIDGSVQQRKRREEEEQERASPAKGGEQTSAQTVVDSKDQDDFVPDLGKYVKQMHDYDQQLQNANDRLINDYNNVAKRRKANQLGNKALNIVSEF